MPKLQFLPGAIMIKPNSYTPYMQAVHQRIIRLHCAHTQLTPDQVIELSTNIARELNLAHSISHERTDQGILVRMGHQFFTIKYIEDEIQTDIQEA